jgi:hypothetical protein
VPSATSAEFLNGGYLVQMNAAVAYNAGATGQGILVADVDTGADPTRPDLVGAISPLSTDIIAGRNQPVGDNGHADWVSSVLAARFNGFGTIGVAYESTVLSIRADTGSATNPSFDDSDIANGVEYAIQNHARVINLSLGSPGTSSPQLQQALANAVAAGIAITISAGNEGNPQVDAPANLATDPRYAGLIVAAGALDQTGKLASFSNQAGAAANGYLVAPGVNLLADCDSTGCEQVSGTSFAAPQVAGAIALLLQAFPNLTAQQAVQILFSSADDLGAPGIDPVYGQGELDLAKAFQPMGPMSVPQANGAMLVVNNPGVGGGGGLQSSMTGGAMGDAIQHSRNLTTVGYDGYQRLFVINLANAYQRTPVRGLVAADPSIRVSQASAVTPDGVSLNFAGGGSIAPSPDQHTDRTFMSNADPSFTEVEASAGRLSLMAWHGQGGMQPDLGAPRDAFQAIAAPDQVEAAKLNFGQLSITAEGGTGESLPPLATTPQKGPSYASFDADFQGKGYTARVGFGTLSEPEGPLGSTLTGAFASPATTRYASVSANADLHGANLYGDAAFGQTEFNGTLLRLDNSLSSSWRVGLVSPCAAAWRGCSNVGLELAQPLRFEGGDAFAELADVPAQYFDPLTFSERRIGLTPSGRELDLRLFTDKDLGPFGLLRFEATAAHDEGNVAGAPLGLGFLTSWKVSF